jgi:flagellar protein FliS
MDEPVNTREAVLKYATSQIQGASPGQLVVMLFDATIAACRRGDRQVARQGLVELMSGLDLDYLDVAGPLFRLYEYCLDEVRKGNIEEVQRILTGLREAWCAAVAQAERPGAAPRLEIREA